MTSRNRAELLTLPPGFICVGPGVFEGPRRKVGPNAFRGLVRVRTGPVDPEDDDHNCDAMMCGSVTDHVLSRTNIAGMEGGPFTAEDYVARGHHAPPDEPTADPTLATLARLVDHERWTLGRGIDLPGTHAADVYRFQVTGILWRWHADAGRWLPDPDDAATGGVLADLLTAHLREHGGYVVISWDASMGQTAPWCVEVCPRHVGDHAHYGPTLGRACVPALAAAWSIT